MSDIGLQLPVAEAVDRLLDDRVRRGLPRRVEDPVVIERVAAVLRSAAGERGSPPRKQRAGRRGRPLASPSSSAGLTKRNRTEQHKAAVQ